MKLEIFLLISFLMFISAIPWDETGLLYYESLTDTASIPIRGYGISDVKIMLYTPQNRDECELIFPVNLEALKSSKYFNPERLNVFIIHGWTNDYKSPVNTQIKTALLNSQNVNVFVVDWSKAAKNIYSEAKEAVHPIGSELGIFLQSVMDTYHLPSKNCALIGHSLGAHVAGNAGAAMNTKPHSIVGLDPALPLFSLDNIDDRLDSGDAEYVQIIHTNGGKLAFKSSLGHADFFPNGGGTSQPGCGIDVTGACAHFRSYEYFAESLYLCNFNAVQCSSYKEFKDGKCNDNQRTYLGCYNLDINVTGDFYLNTNDIAPFAIN